MSFFRIGNNHSKEKTDIKVVSTSNNCNELEVNAGQGAFDILMQEYSQTEIVTREIIVL